jgi:uncharacterized protein GlcG (DUF336 family)
MAITLKIAEAILDGALAEAKAIGAKPLSVVVLDAGGHVVALKRADGASFLRADIARAKAWTALGMEMNSRNYAEIAEARPNFAGALNDISGGRMAPSAGGVLIKKDGQVIGAVGASGCTPDNDEKASLAGVAAAGL